MSLSLGWEQEQLVDKDRAISNAISRALFKRNQNLLIFAAASNLGGSTYELFPAHHELVFSIRGADTDGNHKAFNPSLPEGQEYVFGTLGYEVPVSNRGKDESSYLYWEGTSTATAIAAGIAAIIIGYINVHDQEGAWDRIRTFPGYQALLPYISTKTASQMRFITLSNHSSERHRQKFKTALSSASNSKPGK